jgi:sulfur relay (sulfurtransferase) complex TusBCD TusD component (DsrE family)
MDARGITDEMLTASTRRSTLDELSDWTASCDKVITF